jgi:hypothetical protein
MEREKPMDKDIREKVARAIWDDACPGMEWSATDKLTYEGWAQAAIEAYQKALWTPYFGRPAGMIYPEPRRNWANSLTAHIMNAIGKYLCRHGEQDGVREASRDLFEMLYGSGAYIVTDADRTEAGLPPRGAYGLTREDMKIMELKHTEAMLRPLPPMVLSRS